MKDSAVKDRAAADMAERRDLRRVAIVAMAALVTDGFVVEKLSYWGKYRVVFRKTGKPTTLIATFWSLDRAFAMATRLEEIVDGEVTGERPTDLRRLQEPAVQEV
jgi:hypothetical protein